MSESNSRKRNLPSWMSSREEENDDSENSKQLTNPGKSKKDQNSEDRVASATGSGASGFSTLMEGVTFVLSGFVNPERGVLRSQMLEMGAVYQPDWNSNCTLLVCAFSSTPKFRQVQADGGTIISKDWISECYTQRKLEDIDPFILHAGKPWRRRCISHEVRKDVESSSSTKFSKQEETGLHPKKATGSSKMKGSFSLAKAKKWAVEDLKRTISWLENQEEKPGPSEIKKIAAEGILTCLQDAIDALKQGQLYSASISMIAAGPCMGIFTELWQTEQFKKLIFEKFLKYYHYESPILGVQRIAEQWGCLPRVVEQLAQFDGNTSPSKEDLCREVMACKQIYELEFLNMEHDDTPNPIKPQNIGGKKGRKNDKAAGNDPYDSDATIEMTEDEIDQAYYSIASSSK